MLFVRTGPSAGAAGGLDLSYISSVVIVGVDDHSSPGAPIGAGECQPRSSLCLTDVHR
jgi:hypothetical protein